jgi:hypothetical protein
MELTPVPGQSISLADISRRLGELEGQFNALLEKVAEEHRCCRHAEGRYGGISAGEHVSCARGME